MMIDSKTLKEIVDLIKQQSEVEQAINKSLQLGDPDNYFFGTSSSIKKAFEKLLIASLTESKVDWLNWYMWECDFGNKPAMASLSSDEEMKDIGNWDDFYNFVFVEL